MHVRFTCSLDGIDISLSSAIASALCPALLSYCGSYMLEYFTSHCRGKDAGNDLILDISMIEGSRN